LPRINGSAGTALTGGRSPEGGGGGGGGCFGGGGGGDGGGGGGGSSCLIASSVLNFTTTTTDGTYAAGDSINITANLTKPIADGAQITVTLDTGETVLLTKTGPYTMSGTYVVGASATTGDLTVSSYTLTTPPVDVDGITMTSTTVPTGANNIAGSHAIVIGQAATPSSFTVTAISEKQGPTAGGNTVTITGTGFVAGATVTIGGKACTNVVVVSATSITCVVPAGVASVVDVVVLNGDNQTKTLARGYTYVSDTTVSASATKSLPATGTQGTWLFLVSVILIGLGVILQRTRVRRFS
jgi:LPXTG-motif cell wall-anchored protein